METNTIHLPQVSLSFEHSIPGRQYLLVAGGRPPAPAWLMNAAKSRYLWCIDHGIDCCKSAGLLPLHLFGDGDSASPEAWQWAEKQDIPIEKYKRDKDYTDTQLALEYVSHDQDSLAVLTGCFGKRFDHFYSTLFTCAHAGIPVCLADEQELLYPLSGGQQLTLSFHAEPFALSLLPITGSCRDVTVNHVQWPLDHAELKQSFPNAVSNLPNPGKTVTVSLAEGILGIYLYWE